ncbi:hypothetical protein BJX99DRAFT_222521 [Aspergillus californicus]
MSGIKTLRHADYTVGWICALPKEMAAATAMLDEVHEGLPIQPSDHNTYTLGKLGKHNIAIACLPSGIYGLASASTVAMHLLSSFQSIRFGLLVGIGGGIPSDEVDIRLGDIVVGLPTSRSTHGGVVQYDLGKATIDGKFERTGTLNRPPQVLLTAIAKLRAIHQMGGTRILHYVDETAKTYPRIVGGCIHENREDRLFNADYHHVRLRSTCDDCDSSKIIKRSDRASREPAIHYGLIASGNQVVKDSRLRDRLGHELGAYCVEMEAAGLVDNYPCLVIRGICDYADSHKNKDWQRYAALVAAAYAKELLLVISDSAADRGSMPLDAHHLGSIDSGLNATAYLKMKAQDCLRSLRPSDIDIPRFVQTSAAGTAWNHMFNSKDFREWYHETGVDGHHGLIWIKGKPGSGKSTFTKHAFCRAAEELRENGTCVVAFLSNNRDRYPCWSKLDLFRSLIYQLLQANRDKLSNFISIFDHKFQHHETNPEWSEEELKSYLKAMFAKSRSSRTLIFVDGLDECVGEGMRELALFFREMTATAHAVKSKLSVCLSSREYPKVSVKRCPEVMIDRLNADDIRSYVRHKFETAGVDERIDGVGLASTIVEKSAGIFLWAVIVVDTVLKDLDEGKSSKYLHKRLREIPPALEQLYAQILSTVDKEENQMTLKFFYWVIFAAKPLRLVEWHHILAWIRDTPPGSLREWRESHYVTDTAWQLEQQIRSISKGLVEVKTRETAPADDDRNSIYGEAGSLISEEGETRTVSVIHSTVVNFFLGAGGFDILSPSVTRHNPGDGDIIIMRTCLDYIGIPELDAFVRRRRVEGDHPKLQIGPVTRQRKRSHSEASFGSSASNFAGSVYLGQDKVHDDGSKAPGAFLFPSGGLECDNATSNAADLPIVQDIPVAQGISFTLEQYLQDPVPETHLGAVQRAASEVRSLSSKTCVSETLEAYPALLSYALDAFTIHAARADKYGADPGKAFEFNRVEDVWQRWLYLSGSRLFDTSVLYFAAEEGLCSWIRYLLSTGLDPDIIGGTHQYPLIAALNNGHAEAMMLLLKGGASFSVLDKTRKSPLHHIAQCGQVSLLSGFLDMVYPKETVTRVLLPARDMKGQTPLLLSVQQSHAAMTEKLLIAGADPNIPDWLGNTPLHHACESDQPSLAVCQYLLANGACKDAPSRLHIVPSQLAFQNGFLAGVSLINDQPPSQMVNYSHSKLTVRLLKAVGVLELQRPYILVSFVGEKKILYPIESNSEENESQWSEVHFSIPFETEIDLDFSLLDMKHSFYQSIWRVRFVTEDRKAMLSTKHISNELVACASAACLALEVTVPQSIDITETGEMILHAQ